MFNPQYSIENFNLRLQLLFPFTGPEAEDFRFGFCEVDNGGGDHAADAGIDDQIYLFAKLLVDDLGVGVIFNEVAW